MRKISTISAHDRNLPKPNAGCIVYTPLILALFVAYGVVVWQWVRSDAERAGQFGDMWGGLTALFAGLAVVGTWYHLRVLIWQQLEARQTIERLLPS